MGNVPTMARTLLYLVRHGEQDHAAAETNAGLSPLGIEQAHRLGRRLAAVDFDQIHHSPRARAHSGALACAAE